MARHRRHEVLATVSWALSVLDMSEERHYREDGCRLARAAIISSNNNRLSEVQGAV